LVTLRASRTKEIGMVSEKHPLRRGWTTALAQADGIALGEVVARAGQQTAEQIVAGTNIAIEIILFDRDGRTAGRAPFTS
jgi:hypothetical protein